MQIKFPQLKAALQNLSPIYIISGEEPFQSNATSEGIRQAAKLQGFVEREVFEVHAQFDWFDFVHNLQQLNLFSNKRLIELRMNECKIKKEITTILQAYANNCPANQILMIIIQRLDYAMTKSAWFLSLVQRGVWISVKTLDTQQQAAWLKTTLQAASISCSPAAFELLLTHTEGNLLAAHQAIEKIKILAFPLPITEVDIAKVLSEQAKYSVFDLVEACLEGKSERTLYILHNLQEAGIEPILVLWALTREARLLLQLLHDKHLQIPLNISFTKLKIYNKRATLLQKAIQNTTQARLFTLLSKAHSLDCIIKGVAPGIIWIELFGLCELLSGTASEGMLALSD